MPVETFATNAQGTVHVLDAARAHDGVGAIVIITTDKVYENTGDAQAYAEDDRWAGMILTAPARPWPKLRSARGGAHFIPQMDPAIATARAGNVIGGGDWSEDRLIADAMRAWRTDGELIIRNPRATRPWQHVMRSAARLSDAGPGAGNRRRALCAGVEFRSRNLFRMRRAGVIDRLATHMRAHDFAARWRSDPPKDQPHEAARLELDCSKAREELFWRPQLDLDAALSRTADWCRAQISGATPQALFDLTVAHINS